MECRLCATKGAFEQFMSFENHPIVNDLVAKKSESLYSLTEDFTLNECKACGFLYSDKYFISQLRMYSEYRTLSSLKPQPHAYVLIERIIQDVPKQIESTKVLEIGCNDGSFLAALKENGFQFINAYEPAVDAYKQCQSLGVEVINDFFSATTSSKVEGPFDVIVTRQVLEHIEDLADFLQGVSSLIDDDGIFIVEVPDTSMNYSCIDYTFWEQHINYFTENTLRHLLEINGFYVYDVERVRFSGTTMRIFAKKIFGVIGSRKIPHDYDLQQRTTFKKNFLAFKERVKRFVEHKKDKHTDVYIYGCGNRSQNFANYMEINHLINGYIDDCPTKIGCFTPLHGHPIMSFDDRHRYSYILMGVNSELEEKVIKNRSLLSDQVCSILPPSRRLPSFWYTL